MNEYGKKPVLTLELSNIPISSCPWWIPPKSYPQNSITPECIPFMNVATRINDIILSNLVAIPKRTALQAIEKCELRILNTCQLSAPLHRHLRGWTTDCVLTMLYWSSLNGYKSQDNKNYCQFFGYRFFEIILYYLVLKQYFIHIDFLLTIMFTVSYYVRYRKVICFNVLGKLCWSLNIHGTNADNWHLLKQRTKNHFKSLVALAIVNLDSRATEIVFKSL